MLGRPSHSPQLLWVALFPCRGLAMFLGQLGLWSGAQSTSQD